MKTRSMSKPRNQQVEQECVNTEIEDDEEILPRMEISVSKSPDKSLKGKNARKKRALNIDEDIVSNGESNEADEAEVESMLTAQSKPFGHDLEEKKVKKMKKDLVEEPNIIEESNSNEDYNDDDDNDISDEDSAPEVISFKKGKDTAKELKKKVKKSREALELKMKEGRKKRHERNLTQKFIKNELKSKFEAKKLAADFLELVDNTKKPSRITFSNPKTKEPLSDEPLDSEEQQAEEFISIHGSTEFKVSTLKKNINQLTYGGGALDFKDRLLNSQRIKRQTTAEMLLKEEKLRCSGKILKI